MKQGNKIGILFLSLLFLFSARAQTSVETKTSNVGYFSLGGRSTISAFGDEGSGIGTGGQFRIQLADQINTEWFADYITINVKDKVRSDYYHIGWSVMFYPFKQLKYPKLIQPYIIAGHCFDYNRMTQINDATNTKDRWGSAVQAGLACHFNLTDRFDVTLISQYMIHFTETLHAHIHHDQVDIIKEKESALQGHLLTTVSLNYKLFKMWKK